MSALAPISVVIPSYNGLELLKEHLPSVKSALKEYPGDGEIIIVEDGGTDGTMDWLNAVHPDVRAVRLDSNGGFARAANRGVEEASNGVVILLNNDMTPTVDCFAPLVERLLSEEDYFAAAARSITADGRNESVSIARYEDGLLTIDQPGLQPNAHYDAPSTLFHAAGGFSAYRRERFLQLGGFDPIFHPFYWEDVNLSYRAWKRRWKSVYEPAAMVEHGSHGTIGQLYDRSEYDLIQHGNLHLFHLLNLENDELELYLKRVNRLMSTANLYDKGVLRRGFYLAISRMDAIIERRKKIDGGMSLENIIDASSGRPL